MWASAAGFSRRQRHHWTGGSSRLWKAQQVLRRAKGPGAHPPLLCPTPAHPATCRSLHTSRAGRAMVVGLGVQLATLCVVS